MNATATAVQMIPVDEIRVDGKNPKSRLEGPEFDRFVEGVRQHGVLQAVLVRPLPGEGRAAGAYHLIAGHRRLEAAKRTGAKVIPAVVRESEAADDGELRVLENLERAELHPLDEAEVYRTLSRPPYRLSWQAIADKVGRPLQYVYARAKLADLVKKGADLLRAGRITAGHAVILSRLAPKDQERALDLNRGGVFEEEDSLFPPNGTLPAKANDPLEGMKLRTTTELQAWVDENVRATRDIDPVLFPEAAAEIAQASKVVAITHEAMLKDSAKSTDERTLGPRSWKRADGLEKSKKCEFAITGLIAAGYGRGEAFPVCVAKKKCRTHWAQEIDASALAAQEREKAAKKKGRPGTKATGATAAKRDYELDQVREAAAEKAQDAIDQMVMDKAAALDSVDFLRVLANLNHWGVRSWLARLKIIKTTSGDTAAKAWIAKASTPELQRVLVMAEAENGDMDDAADAMGINSDKIRKESGDLAVSDLLKKREAEKQSVPAAAAPGKKAAKKKAAKKSKK